MPRDIRAYLADVAESCDAIASAIEGLTVRDYSSTRLIRSSVEREFTIIGEALLAISHISEEIFGEISQSRRIVDFRNQLTHQYPTIDDEIVWAIIKHDVPILRKECENLLRREEERSDSIDQEGAD